MKYLVYEKMDDLIQRYAKGEKPIVLFGAGRRGREYAEKTKVELYPYIYDNDIQKKGNKIHGFVVETIDHFQKYITKDTCILIASDFENDIVRQLGQMEYTNILSMKSIRREAEIQIGISEKIIKTCMIESTNICNAKCEFCANPTLKLSLIHI